MQSCAEILDDGSDANTDVATVQVQKVSSGASVIKAPLDMSNQTATFYDDSAGMLAPVPGLQTATDTFAGQAAGTPSVLYTVPDVQVPTRMLALPSRAQKGSYTVYEHPSAMPPLPASQIALSVSLPSAYVTGQSFSVQSIGAWMQYGLVAADLPLPDMSVSTVSRTIEYSAFKSMTGGDKFRITSSDLTLFLRYTGTRLSGAFQTQFDQTNGVDGMSGTMTAIAADKTITATLDSTGYATRFSAVRPAVASYASSYLVSAAPGWSVLSDLGVRLVAGSNAAAATSFTAMYGNPFESLDWKAVASVGAQQSRVFVYTENAMSANVTLVASLSQYGEPSGLTSITMPAGLATAIRADRNLLTNDGASVKLDLTKPVEVDAIIDMPSNTLYEMMLTELGLDTSGAAPVLARKVVLDALATATGMPVFKVPPDLFTVGKSYVITGACPKGRLYRPDVGRSDDGLASLRLELRRQRRVQSGDAMKLAVTIMVIRTVLGVAIAAIAACSYRGSFVDCEISCTQSTGCPPGFMCSASEGLCRSGATTTSCAAILDGGGDSQMVPSCVDLRATCGPAATSPCCSSQLVPGGTFYRNHDVGTDNMFPSVAFPATVRSFRLDTYEVSIGRFRQFVNAGIGTQANPPPAGVGGRMLNGMANQGGWESTWNTSLKANTADLVAALKCDANWTDTPGANDGLPVHCLTWFEAFAFCTWDGGFLPTQGEWNYAAAGGSEQRAYPWSSPAGSLAIDCAHANYDAQPHCVNPPGGAANRVGSESPEGDGAFGQADLGGNVWEWMLDYGGTPPTPCNDCATMTPAANRIIRGGSWYVIAVSLRTSRPDQAPPTFRGYDLGVRCARVP